VLLAVRTPIERASGETRGEMARNRNLTMFGNAALIVTGLCPFTTVSSWWQFRRSEDPMVGLATAMFIGLFAFGHELFGWGGVPSDEVQLGLFLSFILGIVCGYKTKG
jgi:hypothetical protein